MVFSYYNRLTRAQKRVYQESDRITSIRLPAGENLARLVQAVITSLKAESRMRTEQACQALISELVRGFGVPPVRVRVLSARPSRTWGELHGLYEPAEGKAWSKITVWMRTAQRRKVVAFRTFLRTLIHELCHHLDYELLKLEETFHTEGFYKRESSLFHQLTAR